jgi:predicted GH43/DUF377 family glycosyl hydrolase
MLRRPPGRSRLSTTVERSKFLENCPSLDDPILLEMSDPDPDLTLVPSHGLQPSHGDCLFNPGVMPLPGGRFLFSYRYFKPEGKSYHMNNGNTAVAILDSDLKTTGRSRVMRPGHLCEDVRLHAAGDNVADMVYTDSGRMWRTGLDHVTWKLLDPVQLDHGAPEIQKNWVMLPREPDGPRLYSWSLNPHMVLVEQPAVKGRAKMTYAAETKFKTAWKWGTLRGSTPWIPFRDGTMLCVFHSSTAFRSRKETGRCYFAGVMEAEAVRPWRVINMGAVPVWSALKLGKDLGLPRGPNPLLHCLFPSGITRDGDSFRVWCGLNDKACAVLNLPLSFVETILEPVT